MIAIIDYGAGNVQSIRNAVRKAGGEARITSSPEEILKAEKVILPGVGSFALIERLAPMRNAINNALEEKPFLGICLGLQFLFESSEEAQGKGLSFFKGRVSRLEKGVKIPHIGWNQVKQARECVLFEGVPDNSFCYFDHSFVVRPASDEILAATTEYGEEFASAVARENVFAVQFHPEKSGEVGLRMMRNFVEL